MTRFVAFDYRGVANHNSASLQFGKALANLRKTNRTALEHGAINNGDPHGNQHHRLAQDRHAVIGFYNERSARGAWVLIQIKPDGRGYWWTDQNGNRGSSSGWKTLRIRTNGYIVALHVADDDRGGVAWRFEKPR